GDRSDQPISDFRNGLDGAWFPGIVGKGASDLRYGSDQDIFANKHIRPDSTSEVLPSDRFPWLGGQGNQHLHHLGLQMYCFSVALHRVDGRMDQPVTDAEIASHRFVLKCRSKKPRRNAHPHWLTASLCSTVG